ncbi:amidohydrolase [Jeotgalibaca arthritidis]|uniref:amidohydrolase n=1 Tax=Jeotgalibaca arthritidis TaxID=1868794 RepID=UPI001D04C99F|nr:amidohydrolase [Jeotgalibaca arthritidis]
MAVDLRTDNLVKKLVHYRRELHQYPELSLKEYETTERIKGWLTEAGIAIRDYGLETGVIAEVVGDLEGPTIAIRADIDALPIVEEVNTLFKSKHQGVMHACGHDFHTSSIIGAALLLEENKENLKGTVRFIFQPAEEIAQGAKLVVESGALEGASAIFGMHNKPDLAVGTVGVRSGALMASADRFELDVIGLGGHAGIPHATVDPIVVASQIVTAFQSIISRNTSSFDNTVLSVTQLHAGSAWNVIPEKAFLEGTVRSFQAEARHEIPALMERTAKGIAEAYGASIDFRWYPYIPVVENNPQLETLVTEAAKDWGYEVVEAKQVAGGEDFAFYQSKLPSFFVWMGVDGSRDWHHPEYHLNEDALLVSARYFSTLAEKALDYFSGWK